LGKDSGVTQVGLSAWEKGILLRIGHYWELSGAPVHSLVIYDKSRSFMMISYIGLERRETALSDPSRRIALIMLAVHI